MEKTDRNVEGAHTDLTRFLKEKWEKSGLTQRAFVETVLGLNFQEFGSQTLTKFIRGRLRNPPKGLVETCARVFDVSEEALLKLQNTPPKKKPGRKSGVQIGVPRERIEEEIERHHREIEKHETAIETLKKLLEN